MVWGGIRSDGKRVLLKCNGNVDANAYQGLLDEALPQLLTSRHLFQQDGASYRTAKSTKDYFTRKSVRLLSNWPAQSPDLNIIEHLWDDLKVTVAKRAAKNLEELWACIQETWNKIPPHRIDALFASLPRRVSAVIANKGGNKKY